MYVPESVSVGKETEQLSDTDAVLLCESVTATTHEYEPWALGVPVTYPVDEFRVSPPGSAPDAIENEYPPYPPLAV